MILVHEMSIFSKFLGGDYQHISDTQYIIS